MASQERLERKGDERRNSHCSEVLDTKRTFDELYYHSELATLSSVIWYVDCCSLGIYLCLIELCCRSKTKGERLLGCM